MVTKRVEVAVVVVGGFFLFVLVFWFWFFGLGILWLVLRTKRVLLGRVV